MNALEYARQLPGTPSNYFFAGTNTGLYVLTDPACNGFDVATFNLLNNTPFVGSAWHKAPHIAGAVTQIKTTGNALYVLTYQTSKKIPMRSTLYRIPFTTNIKTMFVPDNIFIIAQSNTDSLGNTILFNDFNIISTMPDGSTEQIVLATNRGLYKSSRPGGVQEAVNQEDAQWELIDACYPFFYKGIGAPDTNIPVDSPSTLWPFTLLQGSGNCGGAERSTIEQLAGTADAGPFNRVPPFFTSIEGPHSCFRTIPPITYFWSDGARRISISPHFNTFCAMELLSFPFDTVVWNVACPDEAFIEDPVLDAYTSFFWIKQIGVSGILAVGNERGVVALQ